MPGPAGKALTNAVFHAYRTGASGQYVVLVVIGVTSLVTGTTLMGQIERALNRLYGIEQDRPTIKKYGRAFVLALTVGLLATLAFAMFALGHGIGAGIGDDTVSQIWDIVRWPLALVLMASAIALLFRWSPRRHQPAWSWLAFGSTVSVLLWSLVTLASRALLPVEHHVQPDLRTAGRNDRDPALGAAVVDRRSCSARRSPPSSRRCAPGCRRPGTSARSRCPRSGAPALAGSR